MIEKEALKKLMNQLAMWFVLTFTLVILSTVLFSSKPLQAQDKFDKSVVIYRQMPIALGLSRSGDTVEFSGLYFSCKESFDPTAIGVKDEQSESYVIGTLSESEKSKVDSCYLEQFSFIIHAGALRKEIEKPGIITIVLQGVSFTYSFTIADSAEVYLLDVLNK